MTSSIDSGSRWRRPAARRAAADSAGAAAADRRTLRVVVKDPSGAVIPGATVQLTAIDGPAEATTAAAVHVGRPGRRASSAAWRPAGTGWTSASPASSRTSRRSCACAPATTAGK